jgi:hypothetical protein
VSPAFFARTVWCIVMTDILDELLRKIRPNELDAGGAQRAYDSAVDAICKGGEGNLGQGTGGQSRSAAQARTRQRLLPSF